MTEYLEPWKLMQSEAGPVLPLFETEFRHMENPRNEKILKAIVLKAPDTINIIAISAKKELILVEQFRFGINQLLTELPAGLMDEGETPLQAAKRELMEETGYGSESWTLLGKSFINPAYVTNACFHFLALDAYHVGETLPDEFEDLKVHLAPVKDLGSIPYHDWVQDAIGQAAFLALARFQREVE